MAIIKIDGSTLTSHQGASDITDVVNTSQITEGSNLYFTNVRAVDAVEAEATIDLNSLRVDKGTSATAPTTAFAALSRRSRSRALTARVDWPARVQVGAAPRMKR